METLHHADTRTLDAQVTCSRSRGHDLLPSTLNSSLPSSHIFMNSGIALLSLSSLGMGLYACKLISINFPVASAPPIDLVTAPTISLDSLSIITIMEEFSSNSSHRYNLISQTHP